MSEALEYCSTLNNKLESRFVDNRIPFGPGRIGQSQAGYIFNSGGFRSDEFVSCSSNTNSVLFAGCSITFGFGVELEKTYAYRVYKYLLDKGKASGFFNLGVPGYSSIQSILSIFDYINLYGNPDTIVLLIPQLERDAAFFLEYEFEIDYKNQRSAENQILDFSRYMPVFYRMYKTLYFYCKNNNIRLVSGHWHETDMILQGKRNHADYDKDSVGYWMVKDFKDSYAGLIDKDFEKIMYGYTENYKNEKNLLVGDDNDHPGNAWHYAISQSFINKFGL